MNNIDSESLTSYKIFYDRTKLAQLVMQIRNGAKVVFTNGCFDILHSGHVFLIEKAASEGDILIIGLNSDKSVKRLKGDDRPVNDQDSRAKILSAIEHVDYVILFDEDTPLELIKELKPDILVKGGEYKEGEIVGEDIAEKTIRVEMKQGFSTTEMIKKIKQNG